MDRDTSADAANRSRRGLLRGAASVPLVFTIPSGRVWATGSLDCRINDAAKASTDVVPIQDHWLRVTLPLVSVIKRSGSSATNLDLRFDQYVEGHTGTYWGVTVGGSNVTGANTFVQVATIAKDTNYTVTPTGKQVYALLYADKDGNVTGYGFEKPAGAALTTSCEALYPVKKDRFNKHMGRRVHRV